MHFPANAGLIFLTDELTNDRYLVDTGATLSIVPCYQNSSPSGPLLKGADGQPIPSWGLLKKKTVQFQGKLFTSTFLQAAVAGPILGIDVLRKSHCYSRNQPNTVYLFSSGPARQFFAFSCPVRPANIFSGLVCLAFFCLLSLTTSRLRF
jgi:hypothetical protein